jgi:hypothetical protein
LTGRGVGLGTHPQLIAVLRRAGVTFDETMGVRVPKVVCLDRAGKITVEQPTARTMSAWSPLYRVLRDALPPQDYRLGKRLVRVEQDAEGVTALFGDGAIERGDLLVGADGVRSTVRAQFLPQAQPIYAGYVAWRAVLEERQVPPDIHRDIFELYTFCLPEGEQLLAYPVPGRDNETSVGRRGYNIVWYRPADPLALADMCTDASGRCHATGIPPPLIRNDVIARVKADAKVLLAPQIAEIFVRTDPFVQPIVDLESPRSLLGRMSAPARPRRRSMRPCWPTACAMPVAISSAVSPASNTCSCRSDGTWSRCHAGRAPIFRRSSSPRNLARARHATYTRCCTPTARAAIRSVPSSRRAALMPIFERIAEEPTLLRRLGRPH